MAPRIYTEVITVGGVSIYNVLADPNGVLEAPIGSLAILSSPASLFQNTNGAMAWSMVGSGSSLMDVQVFTASGTWTKPVGATKVLAYVVGSGSGGSSGARQGGLSRGGSSGAGALMAMVDLQASQLAATEVVTVGVGGAGGALVTVDSTNGNPGLPGAPSSFGSHVVAIGSAAPSSYLAAGIGLTTFLNGVGSESDSDGALGGIATGTGSPGRSSFGPSGGGSGGAVNGGVANPGGPGQDNDVSGVLNGGAPQVGGTAGPIDTVGGDGFDVTPALLALGLVSGGTGGGGGGSSIVGAAGGGGNGGFPGGGGGGGGASVNGSDSGAGGSGGDGCVVIVST